MAYFTLLAKGKTLTHQLTVLWGDTVWLPDPNLIAYQSCCHQTRFYFHALYDNINSLFTHHQLLHQMFSNYATWCTLLLEVAVQLFPTVYLPSVPQVPLPHRETHSVSRMRVICLMNVAKCRHGWWVMFSNTTFRHWNNDWRENSYLATVLCVRIWHDMLRMLKLCSCHWTIREFSSLWRRG